MSVDGSGLSPSSRPNLFSPLWYTEISVLTSNNRIPISKTVVNLVFPTCLPLLMDDLAKCSISVKDASRQIQTGYCVPIAIVLRTGYEHLAIGTPSGY
jgi:hypothetical protein